MLRKKIILVLSLISGTLTAQEAKVTRLMSKDLKDFPGKEGLMIKVEYPPGTTDPIHRHNAHAFVHVLEGSVVMQLKGGKEVTLTPGQTFYEGPDETQDIVKLSAGTIATLTAMVLGLLVSSAKNSFDTMNNGIVQSSAKIILLDRDLARYGPETKAAREEFKRHVAGVMEMVWPAEKTGMPPLTAFERATGLELFQDQLNKLAPQNDAQRRALAQAQQIVNELGQTRWFLIEQEQSGLPFPLLVILVFWFPFSSSASVCSLRQMSRL